jgi:hypothetical protein
MVNMLHFWEEEQPWGYPLDPQAQFIWESRTGGDFDPKTKLLEYLRGDENFFAGNITVRDDGSDQPNYFIDLGDPNYLFSHDTIGNAIWGAIAWRYLCPGCSDDDTYNEDAIVAGSRVAGASDEGDDIFVRVGIEAYQKYGGDLTLAKLEEMMRAQIGVLQYGAVGDLNVANSGTNKIVRRNLVNHR